jgi:hypothetical protein
MTQIASSNFLEAFQLWNTNFEVHKTLTAAEQELKPVV